MANPFVHVELNTTDVEKAKAFYRQLFDWALEDIPWEWTTTRHQSRKRHGRRHDEAPVPGAPSTWIAYVEVDDIAAATQKAHSLGATIIQDVIEVPGMGWLSILIDPTGAALGLWQTKVMG